MQRAWFARWLHLVALRAYYEAVWNASPHRTSLQPCGDGQHPPCYVAARESGGRYDAYAPSGCHGPCYNKWQFDPRTWNATAARMGRPDLIGDYLAAPKDQDDVAAYLWAGGAGCSNWAAC